MLQETVPLAYINRLEDLTTWPPEFKNWVLSQLDPDGTGILDEGSDRYWEEDDTRQWYMSVQHVEVGRDGRARDSKQGHRQRGGQAAASAWSRE